MTNPVMSGLVFGLIALTAAKPILPRQEEVIDEAAVPSVTEADASESSGSGGLESSSAVPVVDGTVLPAGATDVEKWCNTLDINDAEQVYVLYHSALVVASLTCVFWRVASRFGRTKGSETSLTLG